MISRINANRDRLSAGGRLKEFRRHWNRLRVVDRLLLYHREDEELWLAVLPFKVLVHFAVLFHREGAHVGTHKVLAMMKEYVWHPSISRVVKDVCVSCPQCQKFKIGHQAVQPPILKIVVGRPFELVAMDLVVLPTTRRKNIGCLMVVDHYSKWVLARPIREKRAETIVAILEQFILPSMIRVPERILTDNGPEFRAKAFEELLQKFSIKHVFTSPLKPASNGAVERVNRTIGEVLRSLVEEKGEE